MPGVCPRGGGGGDVEVFNLISTLPYLLKSIIQQETVFESWIFKVCRRNTNFTPEKNGVFSQNIVNNVLTKKLQTYQK